MRAAVGSMECVAIVRREVDVLENINLAIVGPVVTLHPESRPY